MDSQYLIRGIDNHTYSVPVQQVNLPATEAANQPTRPEQVASETSTLVESPPLRAERPAGALANNDILEMHKMGLGTEIVLAKIKSSPSHFDISLPALQELKAAGLNDAVILAIVQSTTAPTVTTQPGSSATSVSSQPISKAPIVLNDGTPLKLRLNRNLSSADAKEGESVDFEVLEDVSIEDTVIISQGSVALATVTEAQPKRRMGRAGKLNVNIDSVRMVNNKKIPLRAVKGAAGGGNTGKMTGAIVATSIVFFPAAPLFLFVHGKDITIPKGTEITAYVNGDVKLDSGQFAAKN